MTDTRISVWELQEYWNYIETLEPGQVIERHIHGSQMPLWDKICSELGWRVHKLDDGYFDRKRFGYCGVYRLIGLATNEAVSPATISRSCGEDSTGTLYVGESGWLNERVNQMRRSLRGEGTHGASSLWSRSEILQSKFPREKLGVAMLFTNPKMHPWIESDLMSAYLNSFGDTPPLNCSF